MIYIAGIDIGSRTLLFECTTWQLLWVSGIWHYFSEKGIQYNYISDKWYQKIICNKSTRKQFIELVFQKMPSDAISQKKVTQQGCRKISFRYQFSEIAARHLFLKTVSRHLFQVKGIWHYVRSALCNLKATTGGRNANVHTTSLPPLVALTIIAET